MAVIAELDKKLTGLAGHYLRASNERRQVVTTFLAFRSAVDIGHSDLRVLCHGGHQEILSRAMDIVPVGLRSALRRSGARCQPKGFYVLLVEMLAAMPSAENKQFSNLKDLNSDRLKRWATCPPQWRRADFIKLFSNCKELDDFANAASTLSRAGVSSAALDQSIRAVKTRTQLSKVMSAAVRKLHFDVAPVGETALLRPISSVAELRATASEFRNCLAGYVFDVLARRSFFYIANQGRGKAIVHLEFERERWIVTDVCGRSNRAVDRNLAGAIFSHLHDLGISASAACQASPWDAVEAFCRSPRRVRG